MFPHRHPCPEEVHLYLLFADIQYFGNFLVAVAVYVAELENGFLSFGQSLHGLVQGFSQVEIFAGAAFVFLNRQVVQFKFGGFLSPQGHHKLTVGY